MAETAFLRKNFITGRTKVLLRALAGAAGMACFGRKADDRLPAFCTEDSHLVTVMTISSGAPPPLIVQAERPDPDALTARVSFYIADLRSERGQKDLVRRVRTATLEVCPDNSSVSRLDMYRNNCLETAWNGARPQIEAAIDTAMNSKVAGAVPMTVSIGIVGGQ